MGRQVHLSLGLISLLLSACSTTAPVNPPGNQRTSTTDAKPTPDASSDVFGPLIAKADAEKDLQYSLEKGWYSIAKRNAEYILKYWPDDAAAKAALKSVTARLEQLGAGASAGDFWNRIDVKEDLIDGIVRYRHNSALDASGTHLEIYVGRTLFPAPPDLRLRIEYQGERWLSAHSITVIADGQRFEKRADFNYQRSIILGTVVEIYDSPATEEDLKMIDTMAKSSNVVLRIRGQNDYCDYRFTAEDHAMLNDMLAVYRQLPGHMAPEDAQK